MSTLHPTAIVAPDAQIGESVEVGPYCVIGPQVVIGDGCKLFSQVTLQSHVTLGRNCQVSPGAVLGGYPQDLKFDGKDSYVIIGDDAVIRECVTVNRGTGEGTATRIGNSCMLMAYAHVAHNCVLGNEVIMANSVHLGGHVTVDDFAFIGGVVAVHQNVRIGKLAMVGGGTALRQDVAPFSMSTGIPALLIGLNKIGLKRRGYTVADRTRLKRAFVLLWYSELNISQALAAIQEEGLASDPAVVELLAFVQSSRRGLLKVRRQKSQRGEVHDDQESLLEVL